jgi:hypothetical protein
MAEVEQGVVRQIAWKEIFPWWILVRSFRLAISGSVLVLMAAAITLTVVGWGVLGVILSPDPAWRIGSAKQCPWLEILRLVPEEMGFFTSPRSMATPRRSEPEGKTSETSFPMTPVSLAGEKVPETSVPWPSGTATCPACYLRPLSTALTGSGTFKDWLYLVLAWLWKLAVWAFFGAAVTRMAVVRLASEERLSLAKSLRFARQKWLSYVAAPLFPFLGMLLAGLPIAILGLFLKFDLGVLIAGLLWPLALLAGIMIMILLLGLLFGWPLMWATISAEGTDCFDALSRSYAYVFQRPLRYLFYGVVAGLIGALGWVLVSQFAAGVIQLTYWSAGWGLGGDADAYVGQTEFGPVGRIGAILIRFWVACVKLGAVSYLAAYFWVAVSAIYLLLRYDVDAAEMDEVYLEEEEEQPGYGMPPLKTDASAGHAGSEPSGPAAPNPQE